MKYVLVYPDGKYLAIDRDSGGYPYPVNWHGQVHFWNSEREAKDYACIFAKLRLRHQKVLGFLIEE